MFRLRSRGSGCLFACWLSLSPWSSFAQEAASKEEQEALEKAMAEDAAARKEQGREQPAPAEEGAPPATGGFSLQSLNPDLSFIGEVAAAYFTAKEPYLTGEHDPHGTGFTLQQLELAASKSVDPYLRFDANLVFSTEGVDLEEAYATTLTLPAQLKARAGKFLNQFGRINNQHPHRWLFAEQPFAIGRVFGPEGNSGVGGELSWLSPLPWYLEVIGAVTDVRGAHAEEDGAEEPEPRIESALDLELFGAVKQFFPLSDDLSLLWGVSFARLPELSEPSGRANVFGTDVYLKFRPVSDPGNPTVLSLTAEALYRRRLVGGASLDDVNGYAEGAWQFAQRWGAAARYEWGTPATSPDGATVEDPLNPEWVDLRQRISAGVTFWPTEFSRLRVQGGTDLAAWQGGPEWNVMMTLGFSAGAHGAHAF